MKHETIIYVPASQPGPHYVEGGLRPEIPIGDYCVYVTVQEGANVLPVLYMPNEDRFATISADRTILPVCWWHLPAAVPMTEREWFDEVGPSKGYVMDTQTKPGQYRFMTNERRPQFGLWCETLDDAVTDAYNHWVLNGRP